MGTYLDGCFCDEFSLGDPLLCVVDVEKKPLQRLLVVKFRRPLLRSRF